MQEDEIRCEARIIHRGRSLAFIESEAKLGDKRIALATVCKSILVLR